MSGAHSRTTNKAELVDSQDTGEPPEVRAIESYVINTYSLVIEAPIPTMTSRSVYLYPPSGVVSQVKALYMKALAPGIIGAGTHQIVVHSSADIEILFGSSVYNFPIEYNYCHWFDANAIQNPTQEVSQGLALNGLIGTIDAPIYFIYSNYTNIVQSVNVQFRIATREGVH